MNLRSVWLFFLLGMYFYSANAERLCTELLYLDATEEEVSSQYMGMTEEAIYSLIVRPNEFHNKAVSVSGLLAKLDASFYLVPPDSPSAKLSSTTRIEIHPNSLAECFMDPAEGTVVLARGRFANEDGRLILNNVYHLTRLTIE